jgi:hypothetical protein
MLPLHSAKPKPSSSVEEPPLHTNTISSAVCQHTVAVLLTLWMAVQQVYKLGNVYRETQPWPEMLISTLVELWHIFKMSRTQIYEQCVVFLWLAAAYLVMHLHLTMSSSTDTKFSLCSWPAELEALAVSTFLLPFPSQYSGFHTSLTFYILTSNFTTTYHIAMTYQHNMHISLYKTKCPNINIHLQKYFTIHCQSICANMASNFYSIM